MRSSSAVPSRLRRHLQTLVLTTAASTMVACGDVPNYVNLRIGGNGRTTPPLLCRIPGRPPNDPMSYLAARAVAAGRLTMVVDYLSYETSVPSCGIGDIDHYCMSHTCTLPVTARRCLEVSPLPIMANDTPPQRIQRALGALQEQTLNAVAPEGWSSVRAVFTTQPCSEVMPAAGATETACFNRTQLVGCAFNCPVVFDEVRGAIELNLNTFADDCEPEVFNCARTFEFLATGRMCP